MALRWLTALALLLPACSCGAPKTAHDDAIKEIERRHDDMMMRGLGAGPGM